MFFNANEEEDISFEPLPKGEYNLTITNTEYGPSSTGMGTILKVTYQGEGDDRTIFDNFNIEHSNPKAAKIGRGQLKQLCEKAGKPILNQPHDLIGCKVRAEVTHREYNGSTYANIKKYIKLGSSTPAASMDSSPIQEKNDGVPF